MRLTTAIDRLLAGTFATRDRTEKIYRAYACDLRQDAAAVGRRKSPASIDADVLEGYAAALKAAGYAPASMQRKRASLRRICLTPGNLGPGNLGPESSHRKR